MREELEKSILVGSFDEAKALFKLLDFSVFSEMMLEITFNNLSIVNYSFIVHLLLEDDSSKIHDLAYLLLSQPLCHVEGAYCSAYYHAKKAAQLTDFNDVKMLENLLFLHIVPEKIVSDQEAQEVAQKILLIDAKNAGANELIKGRN